MPETTSEKSPLLIGIMAELTGGCNLEPMVSAAIEYIERAGHRTLTICSGNSCSSELRAWNLLARSDCDGIILHSDLLNNDQLAGMKSSRRNVVYSHIDHHLAGYLSASLLLQSGHENIAMVTGPVHRHSTQACIRGFELAIQSMGSEKARTFLLYSPSFKAEDGAEAMQRLLARESLPTAVFFHHENLAAGAMNICESQRVRVPEQVSIMACSLHPPMTPGTSHISKVHQPLSDIGVFAARRVLESVKTNIRAYSSQTLWPNPFTEPKHTVLNLRASERSSDADQACNLTVRECECLEWAAKGKTSWETGKILGVTESTIIYHLRNATRKLNAANRLHAVTKALKASLIEF